MTSGKRPIVSVVIATHNRSALLREALDSVASQEGQGDLFDLETIVVDDASTDDTPSIVARYPVQYIRHSTNQGLSAARNTGIAASRGQFVAFLDDDDLWLPHRLRVELPAIQSSADVGLVYSSSILVVDGVQMPLDRSVGPSGDVFSRLLLTGNFLGGAVLVVLIRRAALDRVGGFYGEGLEDYDMWLRLARYYRFAYVSGPVAVRRQSSRGMITALIATGRSRALYRAVVNRALALLSTASPRFRQAVIDQMETRNLHDLLNRVRPLSIISDAECAHQVLTLLSEYPRLARNQRVRRTLAWFARTVALASPSPFDTASTLCRDIQRSCGPGLQTKRLLGCVWTEVAVGLFLTGRWGLAQRAILRAVSYDPTQLVARSCMAGLRKLISQKSVPARH